MSVLSQPIQAPGLNPDKPIQQPIRVSKRSKQTALGIAVIGGPFAYAYLLRSHKTKLIVFGFLTVLAGIPLIIAIFTDPDYLNLLSHLFTGQGTASFVENGSSGHVLNAWSFYLTPLGLVTVGLNVIIRIVIILDLVRLPKSFYENYKE